MNRRMCLGRVKYLLLAWVLLCLCPPRAWGQSQTKTLASAISVASSAEQELTELANTVAVASSSATFLTVFTLQVTNTAGRTVDITMRVTLDATPEGSAQTITLAPGTTNIQWSITRTGLSLGNHTWRAYVMANVNSSVSYGTNTTLLVSNLSGIAVDRGNNIVTPSSLNKTTCEEIVAAVNASGTPPTTLLLDSTISASGCTIPSNITIACGGGTIDTNQTANAVTMLGMIDPACGQVFTDITQNSVSFAGNMAIPAYYGEWLGAVGDGATDNSTTFAAIQTALPGGGKVILPAGTSLASNVALTASNILWQGSGPQTILTPVSSSDERVFSTGTTGLVQNVVFTDLKIVAGVTDAVNLNGKNIRDVFFERVTFGLDNGTSGSTGVRVVGAQNVTIRDARFLYTGNIGNNCIGVVITSGAKNIFVENSTFFRCAAQNVTGTDGESQYITFRNNTIDGMFPLQMTAYSGSGATVTYTATTLTDTNQTFDFSSVSGGTTRFVRVLPVLVSDNGTGATYSQGQAITDTDQDFVAAGVGEGDVIRTATAEALVTRVPTTTRVEIDSWYDRTTHLPVQSPASATAYTIYQVITQYFTFASNPTPDSHTITFNSSYWRKWASKSTSPPADGTLYEVDTFRNTFQVQINATTRHFKIDKNHFKRANASSPLFVASGTSYGKITENTFEQAIDEHVRVNGTKHLFAQNLLRHAGQAGASFGNVSLVDSIIASNTIEGTSWFNTAGNGHGIALDTGAAGNIVRDNVVDGLSLGGTNGIYLAGTTTDNTLSNNTVKNYATNCVNVSAAAVARTKVIENNCSELVIADAGTDSYFRNNTKNIVPLVAGDFALSAGWGTTASMGTISGVDSRWRATITSSGTGQGANPTITLTYKNGAYGAVPLFSCVRNGGTGTGVTDFTVSPSTSATQLVIDAVGTPVAAETYILTCGN